MPGECNNNLVSIFGAYDVQENKVSCLLNYYVRKFYLRTDDQKKMPYKIKFRCNSFSSKND